MSPLRGRDNVFFHFDRNFARPNHFPETSFRRIVVLPKYNLAESLF